MSTSEEDLWHQNSSGIEGQVEPQNQFGSVLVAANFGQSLHDDLAIGIPFEDTAVQNAGAVNVIYDASSGLTSAANRILFQGNRGVADEDEPNDFFGASLAGADFGQTPHADLAIRVNENYSPQGPSGAVQVIHGTVAGIIPTSSDQYWTPPDLGDPNGRFGNLATANFGLGPHADLAIGMPSEQISGAPLAGAVATMYGSIVGLSTNGRQFWDQGAGLAGSPEPEDLFGSAVTTRRARLMPFRIQQHAFRRGAVIAVMFGSRKLAGGR